ncbi:hypothetical protein CMO88_01430 [Candidatus Woesearchaeota archaeon]|nr:hypothetical protein [Candidatus Woesearchaeota archaeon]|tara:strand:+ start:33560 stop:34117 length:558 start_codon:yes stop_codon:yes gene_type:complete
MTSQHFEQRVGVYVDVQNMYYSAKNLYNAKVNFANILKAVVGKRRLVRANAYVIKADIEEQDKFFNALKQMGFEVHSKNLQTFLGGAKKGDWDVGIAMDMIEQSQKLDTIVLVSGDGDFQPLLQHLRRAVGCRVEVAAFGKSTSKKLGEEADSFLDLDNRRFLITPTRRAASSPPGRTPSSAKTR